MSDGVGIDTDKLRELAKQATPGPWTVETDGGIDSTGEGWFTCNVNFVGDLDPESGLMGGLMLGAHENSEADAAFIAAANPSVVLSLLAELDQARTENESNRSYSAQNAGRAMRAEIQLVRLRGAITEALAEFDRMRWRVGDIYPNLAAALAASVSGHQENTDD